VKVLSAHPVLPTQTAVVDSQKHRFDPRLTAGLVIVGGAAVVALLASTLARVDPHAYVAAPLAKPSWTNLLGADDTGRDIFSQLIYGTRISLLVGGLTGACSTAIAWALGLLSGLSRRVDGAVTAVVDTMLVLPPLLLVILIAAYLGPGLAVVIISLSLISWGGFARVIRGQVQLEVRKPYVEAARAVGASGPRILLRHVGPATLPTALAKFVLTVQYAIVVQASLAFLGLGEPGSISWGSMIHRAANSPLIFISGEWLWWLLPPSLAIGIVVAGFALISWAVEERSLPAGR
jgi:peptide/nickel transport system permease protein